MVQYSVKTCHPYFYNQLYHGVDEYGLAGSWLSDALNTNIHTFEVAPAFIAIEHSLLAYSLHLAAVRMGCRSGRLVKHNLIKQCCYNHI